MGIAHAVREMERVHHAAQQDSKQGGQAGPERVAPLPPGITGAMVLDDARAFAATVLYATDEQLDALTLACAVTHSIGSFTTLPRILASAPEKESGKSTLLHVVAMLSNNPWDADPTSFALRAKFNDREKPTVIIDEISEYYGPSGLRQGPPDLNKLLTKGYGKNATLSLSADRVAVDVSCYCVAALGGLRKAVRDDIWSRCIEWKMKPIPLGIAMRDSLDDDTQAIGQQHGLRMHQWARGNQAEIKQAFRNFKRPHRKMFSRLRQIWGPLYATALVAGGNWPERCVAAFKAMALDASDMPVLSGAQMVLRDTAALFEKTGDKKLFARDVAVALRRKPDVELYEKLTDRGLALLMTEALGASQSMDIGSERAKGFHADPVLAAWRRLEAQLEPADEEEEEDDEYDSLFEVTQITDVTDA